MTATKSPGAVAALGASVSDQLGRQVIAETNRQERFTQAPIRAALVGSKRCEAEGIIARGYAPVLDLCRALITAGYDPKRAAAGLSWREAVRSPFAPSARARSSPLRMIGAVRHTSDAGGTARKGVAQARPSRKPITGGVCPPQRSRAIQRAAP